jgi:mannose-6-phosphate isomerase-like protein (cupin superfamily)
MFVENIEQLTQSNTDYRKILYTDTHLQLVVQSLLPGQEVGFETHSDASQFIRCESGSGYVQMRNIKYNISDGISVVVPEKTLHNIVNTGMDNLKFYTIYGPKGHKVNESEVVKTTPEIIINSIIALLPRYLIPRIVENNTLQIKNTMNTILDGKNQKTFIDIKIDNNDYYAELTFSGTEYNPEYIKTMINMLISILKQIPSIQYIQIKDDYNIYLSPSLEDKVNLSEYYILSTGKSFFEILGFIPQFNLDDEKTKYRSMLKYRLSILLNEINSLSSFDNPESINLKSIIDYYTKKLGPLFLIGTPYTVLEYYIMIINQKLMNSNYQQELLLSTMICNLLYVIVSSTPNKIYKYIL